MSNTNYTFAVARIRALEVSLFSKATIDQLMACKTYEECMHFLEDKGWGRRKRKTGCGYNAFRRTQKDMGDCGRTRDFHG